MASEPITEKLTNENYHSTEMRKKYLGSTQFKDFLVCEKQALAKINGEIEEKTTDALLFGSYVDAYFSNELDEFIKNHPELFNARTGELKAPFKSVETVIEAIKNDEKLLKYLSGEHQVIMTGEIAGEPFKIKIDSYFPDKLIVDQKVIKDLEPVWVEKDGKNVRTDFIDAFGYLYQSAVYQEIVRQNTGKTLPFVLAVTTKEEVPAKKLIKIDQEYIDETLEEIKRLAPRFGAIKRGEIIPVGCGKCSVCRKEMKVEGVDSYKKLFHEDIIEY
ncbi:MAG: PD-(D/E)XK nuclease-like domain-containing protein [Clostridia bacterium]|nr:PD-(D/E)XK nuclease-like domain-containing protein [Clostridia bacterium]